MLCNVMWACESQTYGSDSQNLQELSRSTLTRIRYPDLVKRIKDLIIIRDLWLVRLSLAYVYATTG